ncbi:MAG: biotin/lipoyl-binding protein, partial [Chloroflexi bacterium]|nr:biotin/lipoyl-binding protein [Chloroflexota bacterium]
MGTEAKRLAASQPLTMKRMGRNNYLALLAAFAASAVIGYAAYQNLFAASAPIAPLQTAVVRRGDIAATVSTTGSVTPIRQSKLTFATSGTVSQVLAGVGDKVKAGQVLAKLDTSTLQLKLDQAGSSLRSAQIKLDSLKAGSRPEQIAAAKASLQSAQAKYNDLVAGPTDADLKTAEDAVSNAQAALIKAQGDLSKLKDGPSQDAITVAKADLEKKQATLVKAQADYDRVAWRGDIGARPEAVALQNATSDYQAALATYNLKVAPPKQEDLDLAQKNVESATAGLASAQAKLDQLKAGPKQADVQAGQSTVAAAKADLALKSGPASDLDLAAQQEAIKQAQLSVQQAQSDLDKSSLL